MTPYLLLAGVLLVAALIWRAGARQAAPTRLVVEQADLAVPGLPAGLAGVRLLHLSDLHLHRHSDIVPLIRLVAEAQPDLVAITGDLIGGRGGMDRSTSFLEAISPYPTYLCPGNADYVKDRRDVMDTGRWRDAGATVLINRATSLSPLPAWIAGVDDPYRQRDNLPEALAEVPEGAFLILLAHSPDIIQRPGAGRANLTLCGHTHGGQICLPGGWPPWTHTRVHRRYASGVHQHGRGLLAVSRGVGVTRLPVRYFCPPQATMWRLVEGPAAD